MAPRYIASRAAQERLLRWLGCWYNTANTRTRSVQKARACIKAENRRFREEKMSNAVHVLAAFVAESVHVSVRTRENEEHSSNRQ